MAVKPVLLIIMSLPQQLLPPLLEHIGAGHCTRSISNPHSNPAGGLDYPHFADGKGQRSDEVA